MVDHNSGLINLWFGFNSQCHVMFNGEMNDERAGETFTVYGFE